MFTDDALLGLPACWDSLFWERPLNLSSIIGPPRCLWLALLLLWCQSRLLCWWVLFMMSQFVGWWKRNSIGKPLLDQRLELFDRIPRRVERSGGYGNVIERQGLNTLLIMKRRRREIDDYWNPGRFLVGWRWHDRGKHVMNEQVVDISAGKSLWCWWWREVRVEKSDGARDA